MALLSEFAGEGSTHRHQKGQLNKEFESSTPSVPKVSCRYTVIEPFRARSSAEERSLHTRIRITSAKRLVFGSPAGERCLYRFQKSRPSESYKSYKSCKPGALNEDLNKPGVACCRGSSCKASCWRPCLWVSNSVSPPPSEGGGDQSTRRAVRQLSHVKKVQSFQRGLPWPGALETRYAMRDDSQISEEPLLKVSEVAEVLRCSRQVVYSLIDSEELSAHSFLIGRRQRRIIRVSPAALSDFLQKTQTGS
jgi:excisionase family DNA binding protein